MSLLFPPDPIGQEEGNREYKKDSRFGYNEKGLIVYDVIIPYSDWFENGAHQPVYPGLYEMRTGEGNPLGLRLWNGQFWNIWTASDDEWRGLTQAVDLYV